MGRLIEIHPEQECPSSLTLTVGDILVVGATGGRIRSGSDVVEILGPFETGVVSTNGHIISPEGPPGTVMFLARRPGRATIEVVTGDPWRAPQTDRLDITVTS